MKKILAFIAVLLVVLLFFRNVREGNTNKYDSIEEKYELVKKLNDLGDTKFKNLASSNLLLGSLNDTISAKDAIPKLSFIANIPSMKIKNLKDETYLQQSIRETLGKIIEDRKNLNIDGDTKMSTIETKLQTEINSS